MAEHRGPGWRKDVAPPDPGARPTGMPDPPARRIELEVRREALLELERPGPVRAAALDAATASLRRDVGLCGDRGRAAASHALDAAIAAAKRAR